MATIAFLLYPSAGHWYPSFALADELRSRGHRIIYVGPAETCPEITGRGFQYEPVLEPSSVISSLEGTPSLLSVGSWLLDCHRESPEAFEKLSLRLMPDVVVYDHLLPFWGLIARRWGCPATGIAFSPPLHQDPDVPPISTSWVPRGSLLSRLVSDSLWQMYRARRFLYVRDWPDRPLARLCPGDASGLAEAERLKGFAVQLGLRDMIDPRETVWVPLLRTPLIVTSPREMDFPRVNSGELTYGGPSIDLARDGVATSWDRLKGGRPLVACSFGTSFRMLPKAERTRRFASVIRGVKEAGDVQLVMAVGDQETLREMAMFPEARDAVVVEWFSQLDILKRAHLMISHGGWGSVKECVYYGVPMIVSPIGNDHPGAAARVHYHGLGSIIRGRDFTPARLRESVTQILADGTMRERLGHMSAVLRDFEAKAEAADAIEALVQRSGQA